ncbi:MAG: hypothetical protein J6Y39_05830 [Bacteroidaceae bacterium]|nr:hypothetical protein [Bacteroidaceae bacterium]
MKRIYQFGLLLMTTLLMLTACHDENLMRNAKGYGEDGMQVYFSNELPATVTISAEDGQFVVPLKRMVTEESLTVALTVTQEDGSIYEVPGSVTFEEGQDEAELVVTYNPDDVVTGEMEEITLAIEDESLTTQYGAASYTFKVGESPWVAYEEVEREPGMSDEDYEKAFDKANLAIYREDIMTAYFGVDNLKYKVYIEKDIKVENALKAALAEANPSWDEEKVAEELKKSGAGRYRLVNPYGEAYEYNEEGDWDDSQDWYLVVNAIDPNLVYLETSEQGLDWGYGMLVVSSYPGYYIENGWTIEEYYSRWPEDFGTVKNGVITMPAKSPLIYMPGIYGDFYPTNANNKFGIALPGYPLEVPDCSVTVQHAGTVSLTSGDYQIVADFAFGEDVEKAKYIMTDASVSEAEAALMITGDTEAGIEPSEDAVEITTETTRVYIPVTDEGEYRITCVTYDEDGEAQQSGSVVFEFEKGASSWEDLGVGLWVDDFLTTLGIATESTPFEVEILASTKKPGLYRIENPYADYGTPGSKYIEVNAEDPDHVVVDYVGLFTDEDYGYSFAIQSYGSYFLESYSLEDLIAGGADWAFGQMANGVITFTEAENFILYVDGEYAADTNANGEFAVYLPEAYAAMPVKAQKAPAKKHPRYTISNKGKKSPKTLGKRMLKTNLKPTVLKR